MSNETLKNKFKFRDRLINSITLDGKFRASILKATNIVETARQKHNLNSISAHILGELLIGGALTTSMLKGQERITMRIESNGGAKLVAVEGNAMGEIRGYINNTQIMASGETADEILQDALGEGFLHVTRSLYGSAEPLTSSVALQRSLIAEDLAYFYVKSEQIPTAIRMGISFNDDGSVKEAVGFLVQALPEAEEKDIKQMEFNVLNMPPLTDMSKNDLYIDDILKDVLLGFEYKELSRRPVDFFCSCTRERFQAGIKSLGNSELTDMINSGQQELVCHYCNEVYTFSVEDIEKLIEW